MNKHDCREIYFDILKELDLWENSEIITVDKTLLEESQSVFYFY